MANVTRPCGRLSASIDIGAGVGFGATRRTVTDGRAITEGDARTARTAGILINGLTPVPPMRSADLGRLVLADRALFRALLRFLAMRLSHPSV